ncbi:MAG: hypothetical protein HRF50_03070 [Phycisphaerae bacterium]
MRTQRIVATGLLLILGIEFAAAQASAPEQARLMARRAAEADAFRKLAESVYGIRLNERTYVRDFVAESDEIHGELDAFIRGVRLGEPAYYEDGVCEVPAELRVPEMLEALRSAPRGDDAEAQVSDADFEAALRQHERDVIRVVGAGVSRPDLPPGLPLGVAEKLGPPPGGASPQGPPVIPGIWMRVSPQARLMAIRAARLDAMRRLAERIAGLRLTSRTDVQDLVTQRDEITTALEARLAGTEEAAVYLHDQELIAEVKLVVPGEKVVEVVREVLSRRDREMSPDSAEHALKTVVRREISAIGVGVAPGRYIEEQEQPARVDLPPWASETLEAEGEGRDPEFATPQGRLRAARAAELEAKRKLLARVGELELQNQMRVHDFVASRGSLGLRVESVLMDATVVETKFEADVARVRVAIPGLRVWGLLHEELRRG